MKDIFAVGLLAGFEALKYYTGRHCIGTLDVGVVEQLNLQRQARQAQVLLYFLHKTHRFLLRIEFFGLFQAVKAVLLDVHERKFQQFSLFAALRNVYFYVRQGQLYREGYKNFVGPAAVARAHFRNAHYEQFFGGFFQFFAIFKRKSLVDASVFDVEIINVGHAFFGFNAEYVNVRKLR